jgi:TPR repeat protein
MVGFVCHAREVGLNQYHADQHRQLRLCYRERYASHSGANKLIKYFLAVLAASGLVLHGGAFAQTQIRIKSDYEAGTQQHENGNIKMAIIFFEQGAVKNDPKSQFALGTYYHFGEGVPIDYTKARTLFEQSAAQDTPEANAILGIIYRHGQGVPIDKTRAIDYLKKAAYACSDQAQDELAHMLYTGEGVPPQKVEALAWLYVAAESKNINAADGVTMLEKELAPDERKAAQARKSEIEKIKKCPD